MLNLKVQESLRIWHEMISSLELSELDEIIHEDAIFRSPMAHSPYHGGEALKMALSTVMTVFNDFTYHREFISNDGLNIVLEFSARVNAKKIKGVDLIRFDEEGLIREFEVMIRPMSGLAALGEEMGKRIGAQLKEYK